MVVVILIPLARRVELLKIELVLQIVHVKMVISKMDRSVSVKKIIIL